jgi:DNA-binding ferritin-like protein
MKLKQTKPNKPQTTRQILESCTEGQKKVIEMLDKVFDKADTRDDKVREFMMESAEILREIEELEQELNELLK